MERLPKLIRDPWHRRRFLLAVATFASQRVAAAFARVDRRTVQRTLSRARRDRHEREERADEHEEPSPYEAFLAEVERVEAAAELRVLAEIARAGEQQWQAFAWILERRRSSDYSLRHQRPCRRREPRVTHEELVAAVASASGA